MSKFNKLKSDILLFGVDQVYPSKKKISRPSKICETCHKKYIFKHKCPKISAKLPSSNDISNPFNFCDTFFSDENSEKLKDLGFEFSNSSIPKTFEFSQKFDSTLSDSWFDKIEKFFYSNSGKIKLLHLNINSVFGKMHELNSILDKGFFDFVFIQES